MTPEIINLVVDSAPFMMYVAVLWKLHSSWQKIKEGAEEFRRNKVAAVMLVLALLVFLLLGSNVYALVAYGKTFFSIRVFQMFLIGNCVLYWWLIGIITDDSVPDQGKASESAG